MVIALLMATNEPLTWAARTFLNINGYDLDATDEEIDSWTVQLAQNKEERPSFEEALEWMIQHAYPSEELRK